MMNSDEVIDVFKMLALSQGSYGRLLAALKNAPEEEREEYLSQFEECKTPLDVILLVES